MGRWPGALRPPPGCRRRRRACCLAPPAAEPLIFQRGRLGRLLRQRLSLRGAGGCSSAAGPRERRAFSFATIVGELQAEIHGFSTRVSIRMPSPKVLRMNMKIRRTLGQGVTVHWLDTGVPHAVIAVKNLANFPVVEVGRAVRYHKAFGKAGANVADFVQFARDPACACAHTSAASRTKHSPAARVRQPRPLRPALWGRARAAGGRASQGPESNS